MSILKAFTGHLMEFAKEIKRVFPEDADLRTGYIFLEGLVKINPKSVILGWKECVNDLYKEQILAGNLDYFIKFFQMCIYCSESILMLYVDGFTKTI